MDDLTRNEEKCLRFHEHYGQNAQSQFEAQAKAATKLGTEIMRGVIDAVDQHGGEIVYQMQDSMVVEMPKNQMQAYVKATRGTKK